MNCSGLMIGDWIYDSYHQARARVSTLSREGLCADVLVKDGFFTGYSLRYKDVRPVHLTLAILKRNGFALNFSFSDSIDYVCAIGDSFGSKLFLRLFKRRPRVEFRFFSHRRSDFMDNIVIGDTVHELQHAMRLCGIDKDILL